MRVGIVENMGMKNKMFIAPAIILFFMVVLAFLSYTNSKNQLSSLQQIQQANELTNLSHIMLERGLEGQVELYNIQTFAQGATGQDEKINEMVAKAQSIIDETLLQIDDLKNKPEADEISEILVALAADAESYKAEASGFFDMVTIDTTMSILNIYNAYDRFEKMKGTIYQIVEHFSNKTDTIQADTFSAAQQARLNLIIILASGVVLGIIVTLMLGAVIANPVISMTKVMQALSKGQLDIEIPAQSRKDEIGEMAQTVQVFKENALETESLRAEQVLQEQRAEEEKREAMRSLAESFDSQVGGLISSLSSASKKLQSTAETMRSIADETSQASQTVASSTEQASANVSTVASAMEEMSASASEIGTQVINTRNKSNDTASNAQNANQTISKLNDRVKNIGEVVVAIKDIAEQTNLLALNATIEAARAGDAGKGFAVVADEVKKLANETADKTNEIETRIIEIQDATQDSVQAMERIIGNISEIDESVTGVSAAVEEQNATNTEIVRSVSEASQGVKQVAQIIIEVQKGAGETGASADSVLGASREVAELSENLSASVERFLNQIRDDNGSNTNDEGELSQDAAE